MRGLACLLLRLNIDVRVCCCIWRMMAPGFLVRVRRLDLLRLGDLLVWLVVFRTSDIVDCLEVSPAYFSGTARLCVQDS